MYIFIFVLMQFSPTLGILLLLIFLQVTLSKKDNKRLGLILPICTNLMALMGLYLAFANEMIYSFNGLMLVIFMLFFVPGLLFLIDIKIKNDTQDDVN